MIFQIIEENGQKKIKPLTADAGAGAPVGSLISMYKKSSPSGYLYCDGSTFDETAYPALYLYLGSNVLPDYSNSSENGYVYIKATSGLAENQQENVLNAVKDYTYSKYNTTTSAQKSFVKIGNVGTYTNIVPIGPGTNVGYTENLQNTFTNILSVQVTSSSYAGRYPDAYWQNTNDASLTIIYTTANDSRLCYQVTGILKEDYVDPF